MANRSYPDVFGAVHDMLPADCHRLTVSGDPDYDGVYAAMPDVLEENAGKARFRHAERERYIWWSGNWHVGSVASEAACDTAGGDAACIAYYWVCDHLRGRWPAAGPDLPPRSGWTRAADVPAPALRIDVAPDGQRNPTDAVGSTSKETPQCHPQKIPMRTADGAMPPNLASNAEAAEADDKLAAASDTDRTLIEELLTNGVSLSRVCDLFAGRVDARGVSDIARRVVAASAASAPGLAAPLPRLGTDVLRRSAAAARDAPFLRAHAANLAREAPEELLDPLFLTLMRDPVVLSSGFVVDRDTALDGRGRLRFRFCPFTRAPLKKDVYPLASMQRKLNDYRERTLEHMINTARRLLDERCFVEFKEVMSTAELFIDNLGENTYTRLSAQLATLCLGAYEVQESCLGAQEFQDELSYLPEDLARFYIRMYRGSPSLHGCSPNQKKTDNEPTYLQVFQTRIHGMVVKSEEAIGGNRHDEAQEWLDACDMVRHSCSAINIPVARLRLKLAKARGEGDLFAFYRLVYEDIKSDPEEVTLFCIKEGISLDDLARKLTPLTLLVTKILDRQQGMEWRCALGPIVLEHKVSSVRVHAEEFSDQGWGNAKGNLGLALYDSGAALVNRYNLFGTCRSEGYRYGSHPARVLDAQDEIVREALPGFRYVLEYTVGDGGGHVLNVSNFCCQVLPEGFLQDPKSHRSYTMHDPEENVGLFTGNVDINGKAQGNGEFVYYGDSGSIFVGFFFAGSMKTGILYKGKTASRIMREGRWSETLDSTMLIKFPLETSLSIGRVEIDTDGEEESSSSSSSESTDEARMSCTFQNSHSSAVNVFWVDAETGDEDSLDFSNPIEVGALITVESWVGHEFVAYDESRSFSRNFVVSEEAEENQFMIE